MHNNTALN